MFTNDSPRPYDYEAAYTLLWLDGGRPLDPNDYGLTEETARTIQQRVQKQYPSTQPKEA